MNRDAISVLCLSIAWVAQVCFDLFPGTGLLWLGTLAAVVFCLLQFGCTARPGRVFLGIMPVLVLATLALDEQPLQTLARASSSGLLMVAFIAALSTLRVAAASSALLRRCGEYLLAQSPARSYAILNLGSMLAATVLLFGVVSLFGTMVARTGASARPARRAMLAVMRGYAMMPVWSPIALPFGLVAVHYPDVEWLALLPMSLAALALIAVVGLLADRVEYSVPVSLPAPVAAGRPGADLARLAFLVVGLMTLVASASLVLGWSTIRAAMAVVPVVAVVWLALLAMPKGGILAGVSRPLAEGLANERSILAVMAGAGVCGVLLGALVPVERLTAFLLGAGLAPWLVPALIVVLFMALGQVGFSPTLTFITLAVVVPDPTVLGVEAAVYYATILAIWGLASIGTPFSVPAMVAARLFDETPADVVYRWSPLFLTAAPLGVAVLFGIIAL